MGSLVPSPLSLSVNSLIAQVAPLLFFRDATLPPFHTSLRLLLLRYFDLFLLLLLSALLPIPLVAFFYLVATVSPLRLPFNISPNNQFSHPSTYNNKS